MRNKTIIASSVLGSSGTIRGTSFISYQIRNTQRLRYISNITQVICAIG